MLHQLVFQSLLGEIDYGAMGDFTPAGCVRCVLWLGGAGRVFGGAPGAVSRARACVRHGVSWTARLAHVGRVLTGLVPVQLQPGRSLGVERARRRLDLPGAVARVRPPARLLVCVLGERRAATRRQADRGGGGRSGYVGETDQALLSRRGVTGWG